MTGGLVIDMTPMRTVRVNPRSKTARADAGATWGDFNHATHAFGLATTGGIISTTGITEASAVLPEGAAASSGNAFLPGETYNG